MRIAHFIAAIVGGLTVPAVAAPILPGNSTMLTVTWGPTVAAAGVTGGLLGTATVNTSGPFPVVSFPITGGFTNPDGTEQIDHDGSGLSLNAGTTSLDIQNFVIDTPSDVVDANASVNGVPAAATPIPVFDIVGPGLTLTLSAASATAIDSAFNTTAFSTSTVVGTAVTDPIVGGAAIAEPTTISLLSLGLLGVLWLRRSWRDQVQCLSPHTYTAT